jgi:hypothetical protein
MEEKSELVDLRIASQRHNRFPNRGSWVAAEVVEGRS